MLGFLPGSAGRQVRASRLSFSDKKQAFFFFTLGALSAGQRSARSGPAPESGPCKEPCLEAPARSPRPPHSPGAFPARPPGHQREGDPQEKGSSTGFMVALSGQLPHSAHNTVPREKTGSQEEGKGTAKVTQAAGERPEAQPGSVPSR